MKLSKEDRKISKKDGDKKFKKNTPGDLGLGDNTVHTREDGITVQLRGDSNVAFKWINGEFAQRTQSSRIPLGKFKESCIHGGREVQPHRYLTSITS